MNEQGIMAKLYFRYGAVGSAKTLNLLAVAHNYRQQNKRILILKPALDTRFGANQVRSRAGLEQEADIVLGSNEMIDETKLAGVDCLLVDECQFLESRVIDQLRFITTEYRVPVICYGLRTDFLGNLFPGSPWLLAIADTLTELKAVCACGRKATMNLRIDGQGKPVASGQQTEIGGNDRYVALCRRHFAAALAGQHQP